MFRMLFHETFGECELVRIEGVNWIVRARSTLKLYRVYPSRRNEFRPVADAPPEEPCSADDDARKSDGDGRSGDDLSAGGGKRMLWAIRSPTPHSALEANMPASRGDSQFPTPAPGGSNEDTSTSTSSGPLSDTPLECGAADPTATILKQTIPTDERSLRRVFESLRNGLSPIRTELRPFAVGIEDIEQKVQNLLLDVTNEGGRSVVLRGGYGQGKTFCLQLLRQMALEGGFAVMSTEIDAHENQLDKPHGVYRSLMQSLTFPDGHEPATAGIVSRTHRELFRRLGVVGSDELYACAAMRLLRSELECKPLAWILADRHLLSKQELFSLLAGENGVPPGSARRSHAIPGDPNDWPAFSAGTQGDFASYLLSGIGCLTRFLGFRGLIVILDEMEKWQDLNWKAQSRAGNLLGGLIWATSAEEGSRWCRTDRLQPRRQVEYRSRHCDHPDLLKHSARCGGYPFTTGKRCALGLAIAMTPRGDDGPESTWSQYGLLEIVDLPAFTKTHIHSYMNRIFPAYMKAYGLNGELTINMLDQAVVAWRQRGDGSTRTAIQATVSILDEWRDDTFLSPMKGTYD
jgi:hypothetical protein